MNFIADANPAATTTAGTFLFNTETHELSWDFDGSADGAAVLIADFDAGQPHDQSLRNHGLGLHRIKS